MDLPPNENEDIERRRPSECPDDGNENRVTPTAGGESEETEENHVTPTNIGGEPEGHEETENHVAPNTGTTSARAQSTDFTIAHPTRPFYLSSKCADLSKTHLACLNLNITFKCALCDYTPANKRSTSLLIRHATDPDHLEGWLATTARPLEGKAGDFQSLWSSVRGSLILTGSFVKLTEESATLHTAKHTIKWAKRNITYGTKKTLKRSEQRNRRDPEVNRVKKRARYRPLSSYFNLYLQTSSDDDPCETLDGHGTKKT